MDLVPRILKYIRESKTHEKQGTSMYTHFYLFISPAPTHHKVHRCLSVFDLLFVGHFVPSHRYCIFKCVQGKMPHMIPMFWDTLIGEKVEGVSTSSFIERFQSQGKKEKQIIPLILHHARVVENMCVQLTLRHYLWP